MRLSAVLELCIPALSGDKHSTCRLGIGRIVGDEQRWERTGTHVLKDEGPDLRTKGRIQPGEWLIEEEGSRLGQKRS